jgi:hypothetical protein
MLQCKPPAKSTSSPTDVNEVLPKKNEKKKEESRRARHGRMLRCDAMRCGVMPLLSEPRAIPMADPRPKAVRWNEDALGFLAGDLERAVASS